MYDRRGTVARRFFWIKREGNPVARNVEVHGLTATLQLAALRAAATTGHIKRATHIISRLMPGKRWADVRLPGGVLSVSLDDPYWCRIVTGLPYEPEVGEAIDAALAAEPAAQILDCGANIGYWSTYYADRTGILAIEALPHIYDRLKTAGDANGFKTLHAALWHTTGDELTMSWSPGLEPAASAVQNAGLESATVVTVAIDDIAPDGPLIIKLDVEGAESDVVRGAERVRNRALWIFEDHGKDTTHASSSMFLDVGFRIGYFSGRLITVEWDELDSLKTNPAKGYNFVAWHTDGPWADLLGV